MLLKVPLLPLQPLQPFAIFYIFHCPRCDQMTTSDVLSLFALLSGKNGDRQQKFMLHYSMFIIFRIFAK